MSCHDLQVFLRTVSLGVSVKKALTLTAERFGGEVIHGRYVKIDGVEYSISKDMRTESIGWAVKEMTWEHGNNWTYAKPY